MAKNDTPAWWYDERVAVPAGARADPVYAGVTALRRWMYRHRLLRARAAGVPVVVVGNLTAGGSGKTPMTIALVQRLVRRAGNPVSPVAATGARTRRRAGLMRPRRRIRAVTNPC
jgi:tetraacyldisaccharide-1-P 4'-kinase